MPLLHHKQFSPEPVPLDLKPTDKVFFCPLTKEIFTNYERFFDRTILCNSLVWSCSITEKSNMTYQEALDHEKQAIRNFIDFSPSLQKAILYLVSLMSRSRIEELNDEVFTFVKRRYFIDETIDLRVKSGNPSLNEELVECTCDHKEIFKYLIITTFISWCYPYSKYETCQIVDVFPAKPNSSSPVVNGHVNSLSSDEEDDDKPLVKFVKPKALEPDEVTYKVKILAPNDNPVRTVPWNSLRRQLKREHCKMFIKYNCIQDHEANRVYFVKENVLKRLQLSSVKWPKIFSGPEPTFSGQSPKSKKNVEKIADKKSDKKVKKDGPLIHEIRRQEKELKLEVKRREAEEAKKQKQMEIERKRREREEKTERMRAERKIEIEEMREVRKKLADYMKEWKKQRDDLECDDLKALPTPHEVVTRIPPHLFGNVLTFLEFFHTFEAVFDVKDEFTKGISLELLEEALMDEEQEGPLCDLFFFFLSNLFRIHIEEEGEKWFQFEPGDSERYGEVLDNPSVENLTSFATIVSTWPGLYQGCSLSKLELDSYTLSEVLRLYLLSSFARPDLESIVWREKQRGSYNFSDDTPLRLCLDRPELVDKLSHTSIFNFTPDEKIEILLCLSNQLLSYVTPRDFIDEMAEKCIAAHQEYREDKRSEKRRERDSAADRIKYKNQQAIYEKEKRLKMEESVKNGSDSVHENTLKSSLRKKIDDTLIEKKPEDMTLEELIKSRDNHLKMLDEEENVAKEAWEFRESKHKEAIIKYQKYKVLALGEDRFHRRYWYLNALPGVFVEEYVDESLTEDLLRIKVPQKGEAGSHFFTQFSIKSSTNYTGALINTDTSVVKQESLIRPTDSNSHSVTQEYTSTTTTSSQQTWTPDQHYQCTNGKVAKWYVYYEMEEIEQLIESLNTRGFRESRLHEALNTNRQRICSNLKIFSADKICQKRPSKDQNGSYGSKEKVHALELALRDQLLDLESRIFEGTLGGIKDEDGYNWVDRITHGHKCDKQIMDKLLDSVLNGASETKENGTLHNDENGTQENRRGVKNKYNCLPTIVCPIKLNTDQTVKENGHEQSDENMDVDGEEISDGTRTSSDILRELAVALLQIERGIDRKYLKGPLGSAIDISRRKTRSKVEPTQEDMELKQEESAALLKRWESSLVNATSVSSVSLHLATLNSCIIWSRSVLNASCRLCRRKGDAEKMLLCDSCDRGHHMYCLKPALKNIPSGDWFCPECKPKESQRLNPRKVRTSSYCQEASSDEEDTENEETEEEDEEEPEEMEENDEDVENTAEVIEESSEEEVESDTEEVVPARRELKYKIPKKPTKSLATSRGRKQKTSPPSLPASTYKTRGRSGTRIADNGNGNRTRSHSRGAQKRSHSLETESDQPTSASRRRSTGIWKDLNTCQSLLMEMTHHADSWPFLAPVSRKQVPDYYDVIKNPIDFATMQNKFKSISYTDPAEFIADSQLVFQNCLQYNMPKSIHAKAAVQLGNFFESKLKEHGLLKYKESFSTPPNKRSKS